MFRTIALFSLIVLACVLDAPSQVAAQTGGDVAPVPGPYQSMPAAPQAMPNPYSNPGFAQNMPYWMRQSAQQSAGRNVNANPVIAPNFIPGWVWSPNAPGSRVRNDGQGYYPGPWPSQAGAGQWQGLPPPNYGMRPWGQPEYRPGYGQSMWPNTNSRAPQGYGAQIQPSQ